jgi:hypothetical protein
MDGSVVVVQRVALDILKPHDLEGAVARRVPRIFHE